MKRLALLCLSFFILAIPAALAQQNYDKVEITTIKLRDGIYMLQGAGGNMGLSAGEDGVFLIDDQFSPLTPKILAAIHKISMLPIKFVINTHWHYDHTGGNENLGKMGVIIVAHDNVYKRLSTDQFIKAFNKKIPASPQEALPLVSFNDKVTFHLNGLHIQAHHFPNAHTDTDSVITFKSANVVHMGDIFFNKMYPFIDGSSGGSIYGMIDASAKILLQVNDQTKIIPGHGPLGNKQDLQNFHDMLAKVVAILTPLAQQGMTLDQVKKTDPLKELNPKWCNGFLKADNFIDIVYPMITAHH